MTLHNSKHAHTHTHAHTQTPQPSPIAAILFTAAVSPPKNRLAKFSGWQSAGKKIWRKFGYSRILANLLINALNEILFRVSAEKLDLLLWTVTMSL